MVSQVRKRANHYEVLGLEPAASEAEIKRAFAARMSLFGAHRPGEVPQISAAFETLRDPVRRREYDRSLGLNARPAPQQWGFAVAPPLWTPFVAPAPAIDARQKASPEPHVVEAPVDPRLALIAASLKELAKPAPQEAPPVEEAEPHPSPEVRLFEQLRAAGAPEQPMPQYGRGYQISWRRPGLAIGGLIAGAGLFGTLAGLSVKDNAQATQAEPALSVPLPAASEAPRPAAPAAVPAAADGGSPVRTKAAAAAPTPSRRPTAWADQIAESLSEGGADAGSGEALEASAPAVVAASLPLSNQVIARTIERIGYACGEVASTAAAGAPGVFTVNCTSGHAYQAKPVRGRYHFRRLGGR